MARLGPEEHRVSEGPKRLARLARRGKVDGSAHVVVDRGLIFLFNPDKVTHTGEFAMTAENIGWKGKGDFSVNQEYPVSDRIDHRFRR